MGNSSEEIDLIQLIEYFKKGLKKVLQFFLTIFKAVYHQFILILLFLRSNLKTILIPVLIAFIVGFIIEKNSLPIYKYDAIIKPYYGSEDQINEFREDLQGAIDLEDTLKISKTFGIPLNLGSQILNIEFEPYGTRIDKALMYNRVLKDLDTVTRKILTFDVFSANSKLQSDRFVFRVLSPLKNLNLKMDTLLKSIRTNKSLNAIKNTRLDGLKRERKTLEESLKEVNELRTFYKETTLLELNKKEPSYNTNINFADKKINDNTNLKLFDINKSLSNRLVKNTNDIEASKNITVVAVDFNTSGVEYKKPFFKNGLFLIPTVTGSIIILYLLMIKLNSYLLEYNKKEN